MIEMGSAEMHRARLQEEQPALAEVLNSVGDTHPDCLVIAVNETPPTHSDSFLMMPHIDRRYLAHGFTAAAPERTTAIMLEFPQGGVGGEFVVFDEETLRANTPASREQARAAVAKAGGALLPPVPGTAYVLPGAQPHAVLGYDAPFDAVWRLVVVIAEFRLSGKEGRADWLRLG